MHDKLCFHGLSECFFKGKVQREKTENFLSSVGDLCSVDVVSLFSLGDNKELDPAQLVG